MTPQERAEQLRRYEECVRHHSRTCTCGITQTTQCLSCAILRAEIDRLQQQQREGNWPCVSCGYGHSAAIDEEWASSDVEDELRLVIGEHREGDIEVNVEKLSRWLASLRNRQAQFSTLQQQLVEPPIPPPGQATFCADHKVACDWICPSCVEGSVESTLQQQRQQMEGYLQHKPECSSLFKCAICANELSWHNRNWHHVRVPHACTCGLSALLSPDRSPSPDKEQNT